MKREIIEFIGQYGLSPFNRARTQVKTNGDRIFKTRDAKAVHTKVLGKIGDNFVFADSSSILQFFSCTDDLSDITKRQEFFRSLERGMDNVFLKQIKMPKEFWRPRYGIKVVTEDEKTFVELKKLGVPVKILLTESDVLELQEEDIVQVIDCENFSSALERLPQTVFLSSIDEAYLERYVEMLSGWKENLDILRANKMDGESEKLIGEIMPLLELIEEKGTKKISRDEVEDALDDIRKEISQRVREMTVSGESLIGVLSKGVIPEELKEVVGQAIKTTGLPSELFFRQIPVTIDEHELEKVLRNQNLNEFTQIAEKIRENADELCDLPNKLAKLQELILFFDFSCGVGKWMEGMKNYPKNSDMLKINDAYNLFLDKPQAVSFNLNERERCSILTGANSGGKTTLLEHIIQLISCYQIGLPVAGEIEIPNFSEVYYFAKNKGSANKGAFETLLGQMAQIECGRKTLILADEIESVTEPGVAGKIISATADYFVNRGCFMVIATHLGHEIAKSLPNGARIDGIEAKGLDENDELIVDHNPVLGRLAHSTPELIVEKMARTNDHEYFRFVKNYLNR